MKGFGGIVSGVAWKPEGLKTGLFACDMLRMALLGLKNSEAHLVLLPMMTMVLLVRKGCARRSWFGTLSILFSWRTGLCWVGAVGLGDVNQLLLE